MAKWKHVAFVCALAACDGGNGDVDAGGGDAGGSECPAEVVISGEIDADTSWECPAYVLSGRVYVVNGSALTIAPGTTIFGDTAGSEAAALVVTRGSRLVAEGTAEAPIVFTSGNPEGARASGDWAGVVLLGAATTNDGNCVGDGEPATDACDAPGYLEDRIEGIESGDERALYGGTDDASDCGSLRYVRIEFAGRELSPDNELNGLTVGACGSDTSLSYLQVHRGKDDGIEFFGGTASMDHVVITGASDDSLDFDEGWRGRVQFLVIHQFPGIGDRGIEADNLGADEDAEPRTRPEIWNLTMIGTTENQAMLLREGMQGLFHNAIIHSYGRAPDVVARQADPNASWPSDLVLQNTFFSSVADFPLEDLDENGVYELARSEDSTLPAERPTDDMGLTMAQVERLAELETEHLDDDFGFDEATLTGAAERDNTFDADPSFGSTDPLAPDYVPGNTMLEEQGTPSFGDTTATFAGAIAPNGTDWTLDWTAYPAN